MDGDVDRGTAQARQALHDGMVTLDASTATCAADGTVAAMALRRVPPGREWDMVDRALHAMEARDWPAVIVPISRPTLAAPSIAYRVRDLVERHGLDPHRLWLEIASSEDVLDAPGVVTALARRHRMGCGVRLDEGFEDRALVPELSKLGITFMVLHAGQERSVASDLSAMIIGRSLSRRARAHGITTVGPAEVDADVILPHAR